MLYFIKKLRRSTYVQRKKKGKVIVSILMVCILFLTMFTVAGCGKKTIVGVWVAESDGEKSILMKMVLVTIYHILAII